MKINIKINNEVLNKIISFKIRELYNEYYNIFPLDYIYQKAIEFSVINCFVRVIKNLNKTGFFNYNLYFVIYSVCEAIIIKKFKELYLTKYLDYSKANFLKFAKEYYNKISSIEEKVSTIYI
ncbi:MAG: hypothetical protein ACTSPY_00620 [Candidatus Helarchaeota archaeon]